MESGRKVLTDDDLAAMGLKTSTEFRLFAQDVLAKISTQATPPTKPKRPFRPDDSDGGLPPKEREAGSGSSFSLIGLALKGPKEE